MDLESFDRIYDAFRDFHAFFAPVFGRKQWRDHSRDYMQALLVQAQERRNAENLSEAVAVSARALQRFLTDARWDDNAVMARLQEYLGPRLSHPLAVWVFDGSDFPKQGVKSVGVARQYCGALGKVANCQAGVFLAHVGPRGRALVDKRLYLPEKWVKDAPRCEAAGVPEAEQSYRSKTELALEMLRRAKVLGHLEAKWVTGDDAFGMSPDFRDGVAAEGFRYVLEVPPDTPVWPLEPTWVSPEYSGHGRPPKPRAAKQERQTVQQRADAQPNQAWRQLTVAEGAQGPRTYLFSAERVRETRNRKPGEITWLAYRKNLDGSEPRYYFSNAPADTPLKTLARVSASRWPIETEFETEKSDIGLDEYEVRTWHGWHHHITMCLLASAFLLTVQQEWGKKACPERSRRDAPDHASPSLPSGAGDVATRALWARRPVEVA